MLRKILSRLIIITVLVERERKREKEGEMKDMIIRARTKIRSINMFRWINGRENLITERT